MIKFWDDIPGPWVLLLGHCVIVWLLLVRAETKISSLTAHWYHHHLSYSSSKWRQTEFSNSNADIFHMGCLWRFMYAFNNSQWIVSWLGLNICTSKGRLLTSRPKNRKKLFNTAGQPHSMYSREDNPCFEECQKAEVIRLLFFFNPLLNFIYQTG